MSAPERDVLAKVRQWAAFADEDLRLARHALTLTSGCPYRLIAYHGQQCAEKYLKAFLVCTGIDFPYTHNIRRLRELCETHAQGPRDLEDADGLSVFATTTRYPGEDAPVRKDETLRALDLAQEVRVAVRQSLEHLGVGLPRSAVPET